MITVTTLGNFQISNEHGTLNEKSLRSPMMTKLLMYMLIYRDKVLTTDNIISAIWSDEEIDNPVGALKNLMYRLRKTLNANLGDDIEFIITSRGSYQWNSDCRVVLDVEKFEELVNKAKSENIIDKSMSKYEQAIELYGGDFMSSISDCHWIITLNTYYRSVYISAVKALADLYSKAEQYELLEKLVTDSLYFESADEQLFCYQIEARMRLNKINLALESYEKARTIMEKEMGIRKSTVLNKVYEELLAMSNATTAYNMEEVHEDIVEENPVGVFFCGYPIFREIYHLEARKNTRSDDDETLMLINIEGKKEDTAEVANFRIKQAMDAMELCIKESLRVGDVASRYSDTQFILLLPSCNDDLAHLVGQRLITKLHEKNAKHRNVSVKLNIENVTLENDLIDPKNE